MTQASMLLPDDEATVAFTVDAAGYDEAHTASKVLKRARSSASTAPSDATTTATASREDAPSSSGQYLLPSANMADAAANLLPINDPLVVLVDEGTASSAELFAAALRDNGRAVLLGQHTFGKGLIQRVFPLPNGGALKLTIGEYLTPRHEHITQGVGLQPDVACQAVPSDGDACLTRAATMARSRRPGVTPAGKPRLQASQAVGWRAAIGRMPKV